MHYNLLLKKVLRIEKQYLGPAFSSMLSVVTCLNCALLCRWCSVVCVVQFQERVWSGRICCCCYWTLDKGHYVWLTEDKFLMNYAINFHHVRNKSTVCNAIPSNFFRVISVRIFSWECQEGDPTKSKENPIYSEDVQSCRRCSKEFGSFHRPQTSV